MKNDSPPSTDRLSAPLMPPPAAPAEVTTSMPGVMETIAPPSATIESPGSRLQVSMANAGP